MNYLTKQQILDLYAKHPEVTPATGTPIYRPKTRGGVYACAVGIAAYDINPTVGNDGAYQTTQLHYYGRGESTNALMWIQIAGFDQSPLSFDAPDWDETYPGISVEVAREAYDEAFAASVKLCGDLDRHRRSTSTGGY